MRRLRPFLYFLHQAWLQFIRDRALSGTAVAANLATLFVSGLFLLIAFNLHQGLESIRAQREVQVFLDQGSAEETWSAIGGALEKLEGVSDATLVTPAEALKDFERDFGESGIEEALGGNPLPPSYRLSLDETHRDPDAIARVARSAESLDGVESVAFGATGLAEVEARVRAFAVINLVVGILAGLAATLIVANTIGLTILARRELVAILKLIGARDAFVRGPFVLEGAMQGVVAGLGALAILRVGHAALASRMAGTLFFPLPVAGMFLLFAAVLGALGAFAATLRPLREHWGRS